MKRVLSCDLHDYLEIACLYRYRVTFVLITGDEYTGTPKTIVTKSAGTKKYEVLLFAPDNGDSVEIELLLLKTMHVHTPHAKFTDINF
jgi:Rho-binding antiterminator